MYNITICDDGENVCTELEEMLLQYQKSCKVEINIEIWNTGEGLHDYLMNGNKLDIIFLDIELLKLSGIEVADFIRNELENRIVQIIYISSKQIYAQSLFKTQPLDFFPFLMVALPLPKVLSLWNGSLFTAYPLSLGTLDPSFSLPNGVWWAQLSTLLLGVVLMIAYIKNRNQREYDCIYRKKHRAVNELPCAFF